MPNSTLNRTWPRAAPVPSLLLFVVRVHAGERQAVRPPKILMTSGKRDRRLAAQHERERRWAVAETECPLTRTELEALWDHVAEHIGTNGHDHSFSAVTSWLVGRKFDAEPVLTFLRKHRIRDDFSLLVEGDPHRILGPTSDRLARMPLDQSSLEALISWLDRAVRDRGCDHTSRLCREWLAQHNWPVALAEMALLAQRGGCDCEVVLNVEPESIFPRPAV